MRTMLGAVALIFLMSCTGNAQQELEDGETGTPGETALPAMIITSAAFADSALIPMVYTCDSIDISPPLHWEGIPDSAQSLALIVDDPDAPGQTWVHWVMFDMPPDTHGVDAHVPTDTVLANGAIQGISDFKRIGYGGPCPPGGTHRYVFKLYALDTKLGRGAGETKAELLHAMKGHIMARGKLVGRYTRRK